MPPAGTAGDVKKTVREYVANNRIMVFSKSYCAFCDKIKKLFRDINKEAFYLELDLIPNGAEYTRTLVQQTGQRSVPNVFINNEHIGGCDDTLGEYKSGKLMTRLYAAESAASGSDEKYDYDFVVIGGGSGGLSSAKEAARFGARVALCDFVKPSPMGTVWGLGGTCVNVGCIPKKLMHQASLLGESLSDAKDFGWDVDSTQVKHQWTVLRENVRNHISSLNFGYRVQLREKSVTYLNAFAEFVDPHTIKTVDNRRREKTITSRYFLLATGGRPKYPDIPGAREYCITSDDVFFMEDCPGKTLCIGASYISLECAGFLRGLGLDVTVMVRSILLRGFDQQMAEMIGLYMKEDIGVSFIYNTVPVKIERIKEGNPGLLRVTARTTLGEEVVGEYNTVLIAVGRDACTSNIGLDTINVALNKKNGKVLTDEKDETNVPGIFAVGDILDGKPELTPVAIQAGRLLAGRLFGNSKELCDYANVPTTVFTPVEYGAVGMSEEDAIAKYGKENIEVFHRKFLPLEVILSHRTKQNCYGKLVCLKDSLKVIGFHVFSPNAGEITQGFALAMKLGATKMDFDRTIGIHPTCTEAFTTMYSSKSETGDDAPADTGC